VPADNVVATIVSVVGASMLPLSLPFAHRYSRRVLVRAVTLLGAVTVIGMVAFSMRQPFDAMHQKRLFVIHAENVT
jgi:fumarate reductase subunit D